MCNGGYYFAVRFLNTVTIYSPFDIRKFLFCNIGYQELYKFHIILVRSPRGDMQITVLFNRLMSFGALSTSIPRVISIPLVERGSP